MRDARIGGNAIPCQIIVDDLHVCEESKHELSVVDGGRQLRGGEGSARMRGVKEGLHLKYGRKDDGIWKVGQRWA